MQRTIRTSRAVSTATEIALQAELDRAGVADCGEWLLVHPADLTRILTSEITESLWAFRPSFLRDITGIDTCVYEAIQSNERCEDNNPAILAIVRGTCGVKTFAREAVKALGAGHFLASYDDREAECPIKIGRKRVRWTAYRTN